MNIYNYSIESSSLQIQEGIPDLVRFLKDKYNFFIETHDSDDLNNKMTFSIMDLRLSQEEINKLEKILSKYKPEITLCEMINESREEFVKKYREKIGIS